MNKQQMIADLISKGMTAENAEAFASANFPHLGSSALDGIADQVASLAKGTLALQSVEALRADFEHRAAAEGDLAETMSAIADQALEVAQVQTQTLAKGISAMLGEIKGFGSRLAALETQQATLSKGMSSLAGRGSEPARPLSIDPTAHGVIPAPGDPDPHAPLVKGLLPSRVIEALEEKAKACDDPMKRREYSRGIALAMSGGDLAQINKGFGLNLGTSAA